jgi:hypothetical protein
MDRQTEQALFARLAREPKLEEWLRGKLQAEVNVLLVNNDLEQLRKAQGRAQFINQVLDQLDAARRSL